MMEKFWWEEDDDKIHEAVIAYVESLEASQSYIHELNIRNARLYSNVDLLGLDWTLTQRDYSRKSLGRVTENLVQSACDTATSIIAGNRARVTFRSEDHTSELQSRRNLVCRLLLEKKKKNRKKQSKPNIEQHTEESIH